MDKRPRKGLDRSMEPQDDGEEWLPEDFNPTPQKRRKVPRKIRIFQQHHHWADRTVLLFNCKEEPNIIANKVRIDFWDGERDRRFWAKKNVVGTCCEAIAQYCRIGFDLFPEDILMSVMALIPQPLRLNTWHREQQQLSEIIGKFGSIKTTPPSTLKSPVPSFKKGLEMAVKHLGEPVADEAQGDSHTVRLVCLFQDQSGGVDLSQNPFCHYAVPSGNLNIIDIVRTQIEKDNVAKQNGFEDGKVITHCSLILISIIPDLEPPAKQPQIPGQISQVSPLLTVETYFISVSNLQQAFDDLAVTHFNLSAIQISDFPVVKPPQGTPHSNTVQYAHFGTALGSNLWKQTRSQPLQLEDLSLHSPHTLPSHSVHRITPENRNHPKALALIKSLTDGNSILFRHVGPIPALCPQLMLTVHADNDIYIHHLYDDGLHLETLPEGLRDISDQKSDNLRLEEFINMTRENIFTVSDPVGSKKSRTMVSNQKSEIYSTKRMDQLTRFFPLAVQDSILFSSDSGQTEALVNFKSIFNVLQKAKISKSELTAITDNIPRLAALAKSNSTAVFTESSEPRQARYVQFWREIRKLAEALLLQKKTSPLMALMDNTWPELVPKIVETPTSRFKKEDCKDTVSDPSRYRYTPQYKYDIPPGMNAREDLSGREPLYKDKFFRIQSAPHPLATFPTVSLYHEYWKAHAAPSPSPEFDGYPPRT